MKKRLALAISLLSLGSLHSAVLAGSLEPASLALTMKTRKEVEARTAIHGPGPVTIAAPGSYFLTSNIDVAREPGIIIRASNVTLDLNGFTISGNLDNLGVVTSGNTLNVVVRNGTIRNFVHGILNA